MNWRPFSSKKTNPSQDPSHPSTLDRLLAPNVSREEFFLLYSKLLQERMPDASITFSDESALRIVNADGKDSITLLDNLWLRFSTGSEDRRELIERFVRFDARLGDPAGEVLKTEIVAMIKDSRYLRLFNVSSKMVTEHLCGDLWVVYAIDEPESISTLKHESMINAGVARSEIRALAVENLKRILPPAECQGDGPWYLMTAGTGYVASLLLIDTLWDQVADMVTGDIVATVPTRDVLMFTGSASAEGINAIRIRSADMCYRGSHAISNTLVVRRGGTWSVFNAC